MPLPVRVVFAFAFAVKVVVFRVPLKTADFPAFTVTASAVTLLEKVEATSATKESVPFERRMVALTSLAAPVKVRVVFPSPVFSKVPVH